MTYQDQPISQSEVMQIPVAYDYVNQAWVKYGRYEPCGHSEDMKCNCYGRIHAGEMVASNGELQ